MSNVFAVYVGEESFQLLATGETFRQAMTVIHHDIDALIGGDPIFVESAYVVVNNQHRPDLDLEAVAEFKVLYPGSFDQYEGDTDE